jgi:hypothetical protein
MKHVESRTWNTCNKCVGCSMTYSTLNMSLHTFFQLRNRVVTMVQQSTTRAFALGVNTFVHFFLVDLDPKSKKLSSIKIHHLDSCWHTSYQAQVV